jgi:glycine dehydrogenase
MLLNFQTLVVDLTGLPMAVASLLDASTAAAEAMQMCFALRGKEGKEKQILCFHRCPSTDNCLD